MKRKQQILKPQKNNEQPMQRNAATTTKQVLKGTGKANGNTKDPCEGPRNFRQPRSLQRMLEIVSILFKSRTTHRLYPSETEGRTYEHIPPRNQISSYRYIRLDSEIAYRASCLLGPVLGPQEIPDCPAPLSKNGYKRTLMKKKKALKASKGRALNTNGHPLMNQREEPKPIG